jgi:hypothetical protein
MPRVTRGVLWRPPLQRAGMINCPRASRLTKDIPATFDATYPGGYPCRMERFAATHEGQSTVRAQSVARHSTQMEVRHKATGRSIRPREVKNLSYLPTICQLSLPPIIPRS